MALRTKGWLPSLAGVWPKTERTTRRGKKRKRKKGGEPHARARLGIQPHWREAERKKKTK